MPQQLSVVLLNGYCGYLRRAGKSRLESGTGSLYLAVEVASGWQQLADAVTVFDWQIHCRQPYGLPRNQVSANKTRTAARRLVNRDHGNRTGSARAFADARKDFAEAIKVLRHNEAALLASWTQELHSLWGHMDDERSEAALWNAVQRVPRMGFREFQDDIEKIGDDLARREIAVYGVLSCLNALQDEALRLIGKEDPKSALGFLRMSLLARDILVVGYARHWEARAHTMEARLKDAEHRLHGTSSYVTGVYERERRRLSHDLHDEIGHELVVLKLRLELIAADVGLNKLSLLTPRLNDALELIGRAIDSVRRLVMDLGPAVFDDLGFLPAIRLYARQFSASTGIEVTVREGDMPPQIAMSHQTALYRVLQGALSNVLRHARAKHVILAFACLKNSQLMMTIEDDGTGFDMAEARNKQRFGLTAMRERIAVLGGKVHVQSWPVSPLGGRRGTRIEVDLPLTGAGAQ